MSKSTNDANSKGSSVTLDLDDLKDDDVEPFTVAFGGRDYVLADVRDRDYRDLEAARKAFVVNRDLKPSIELMVAEEDREEFFANAMSTTTLSALFNAYNEHFGIENPTVTQAALI
jgi:hypothetical protein